MKKQLGMMLAMSGIFGAMAGMDMGYDKPTSKPKQPERKLTPEEIAEIIKQRVAKFNNELLEENERLSHEHKNWRCHLVNDRWWIVASNQKNAVKKFNYLMKSNFLLVEHLDISI